MRVIHSGVGLVTESDVLRVAASDAVVFAFHVGVDSRARELANREKIDIHQYQIIYEVEEKIHAALEGMLEPEIKEDILGEAVVQQVFKIAKLGTISGSQVKSGLIRRNAKCRILRDREVIYTGVITSLKRFKDDVREVQTGFECGIGVDNYADFQADDVIQCFEVTSVKRKLETAPSTRPTTKAAGGLAYRRT